MAASAARRPSSSNADLSFQRIHFVLILGDGPIVQERQIPVSHGLEDVEEAGQVELTAV
ncbi:hypothetical protein [Paludisphaera borealis]|uniref:hypothetical protein n=1 Tax=Paludisphaera borealis TaxID=1387353 RepID=UPI00143DB402|nr:hypothetical protein [Paludisphaera borealis]